jgi:hypothetical protein
MYQHGISGRRLGPGDASGHANDDGKEEAHRLKLASGAACKKGRTTFIWQKKTWTLFLCPHEQHEADQENQETFHTQGRLRTSCMLKIYKAFPNGGPSFF